MRTDDPLVQAIHELTAEIRDLRQSVRDAIAAQHTGRSGLERAVTELEKAAGSDALERPVAPRADQWDIGSISPDTETPMNTDELAATFPQSNLVHGKTCRKVPHTHNGHAHGVEHDGPYASDGNVYCGRCHEKMAGPDMRLNRANPG